MPITPLDFTDKACLLAYVSEDDFVRGYLECALWSTTESDEDGNMGEPLDENHSVDDLDLESLKGAIEDCIDFQEANEDDLEGLDLEQAGHDFWLTRNRHGAGFWDGNYEVAIGQRLTDAAHVYGGVDLMAWQGVISGHR